MTARLPAVLGALTSVPAYVLARRAAGRAAGLLAAVCVAVLPGQFLSRTRLGFADHHALEALLAPAVVLALGWGASAQAQIVVTTTDDGLGIGSLRDAILEANEQGSADQTITLDSSLTGSIVLDSALLVAARRVGSVEYSTATVAARSVLAQTFAVDEVTAPTIAS